MTEAEAKNCRECGAPLSRRFCSNCGLDSQCACGATLTGPFCGHCGTPAGGADPATAAAGPSPTTVSDPAQNSRSRWLVPAAIAAVIAVIIGTVAVVAASSGGTSGQSADADLIVVEDSTTTTSTTTAPATSLPPATTVVPTTQTSKVACSTDLSVLNSLVANSGDLPNGGPSAQYLSSMEVDPKSIRTVMDGEYVEFAIQAKPGAMNQGLNLVYGCNLGKGRWLFVDYIAGPGCRSSLSPRDRQAMVLLGQC